MLCAPLRNRLLLWFRDYDKLQSSAIILIYIQIGCELVGSLGALYNGVLLINLAIALFALVAIDSGSQRLGRTYGILLIGAILLDIIWFVLFLYEIWHISSEDYGVMLIFSVRLALAMQIIAFSVRFLSSFLWMRMYAMGAPNRVSQEGGLYASFLNPSSSGNTGLSQELDLDSTTSDVPSQETDIDMSISSLKRRASAITVPRTIKSKNPLGPPYDHPAHFPTDTQYLHQLGGSSLSDPENTLRLSTISPRTTEGGSSDSSNLDIFNLSMDIHTSKKVCTSDTSEDEFQHSEQQHLLGLTGSSNIAQTSKSAP